MELTVVVATFGDPSWSDLAEERAVPSVGAEGVPVLSVHGQSLHGARNLALELCPTEWVVFLDADDELEAGYVAAMAAAEGDVRVPQVRYVRPDGRAGRPHYPRVAGHQHECSGGCLPLGNWVVVGAAVRVEMLRAVGGWHDHAWSEDWCTWARCWQAGAEFGRSLAVYRAHVRFDSRNRGASAAAKLAAHREIAAELGFPVP